MGKCVEGEASQSINHLVVDVLLDEPLGWGSVVDGACSPDASDSGVPGSAKTMGLDRSNGQSDPRNHEECWDS